MRAAAVRVQETLKGLGVEAQVREFGESARTAPEAAAACGVTVGQIAKSLVFLSDGRPVLVVASGVNRVDEKRLADLTGGIIGRADAETVRKATGFSIGGVPPVGHVVPLEVYIDRDLLQYDRIWAAAGTPYAVFPLTPEELVRITGGRVADLKQE